MLMLEGQTCSLGRAFTTVSWRAATHLWHTEPLVGGQRGPVALARDEIERVCEAASCLAAERKDSHEYLDEALVYVANPTGCATRIN